MNLKARLTPFARLAGKALTLLLALALLTAAMPQATPAQAASCASNYTVVSGDTLSAIADKNKLTVAELATANDLKEPYTLQVGQTLCIPGAAATTTTTTTTEATGTDPTFKITVAAGYITLNTANFPTKNVFYVKVGEGTRHVSDYQKVGTLRTKKTGAVQKTFRLPKTMRTPTSLTVCVKNALTDETLCKIWTGNPK
jgi:murein DD-endopeptidase MepM/ murein hydrolase activator NlpD